MYSNVGPFNQPFLLLPHAVVLIFGFRPSWRGVRPTEEVKVKARLNTSSKSSRSGCSSTSSSATVVLPAIFIAVSSTSRVAAEEVVGGRVVDILAEAGAVAVVA